ncbi:uncharacterized protein LOC136080163 [Hydra vulgaris]|uniref:Uncharacterized protein LOC136080163 n=1 Tax=Hydra vulgaris TaxID=6087 RepID=A0ABM4BUJ2_HYDVU
MFNSLIVLHTKFEIDTDIPLKFVLESDGCEIDPEDFPFVVCSDTSIIVLQPNENWNEHVVVTDTSHSSNIIDAITPSFHSANSNIEVTPTPSKALSSVFMSQASFESFLLQHSKSKLHMLHLKTVGYGIAERVSITYVTAAKVIDLYGFYPPKDKLNMVSVFLSGITGLKPEDFFEPKSHKGEQNRKRIFDKITTLDIQKKGGVFTEDDFSFVGCYRGLEVCEFCEGADVKTEIFKLATLSATVFSEDLLIAAKKTFCYRQKKIEQRHPSYLECAQQIPCHLLLPQLLLQDFRRMHPGAADCFITRMLTLVPSILAYCSNSTLEYLQKFTKEAAIGGSYAQVTSAIKALIFLLPMTGKKRLTAKESFDLLITYVEVDHF